jgi:K+-transporting ATPase KdpF subunit
MSCWAVSFAFLSVSSNRVSCCLRQPPPRPNTRTQRDASDTAADNPQAEIGGAMADYILLAIVAAMVVYLFYAVINPEKF